MTRAVLAAIALLSIAILPQAAAALTPFELNEAGKAAYGRGDFETAARRFGEAIVAAPEEPLYHYHRGAALLRLGRHAEARTSYEQALSLKPPPGLAATISAALREFGSRAAIPRARDVDVETVGLETAHGVWFAEVTLNGRRRARFLVDTGATSCAISAALAQELGIRIGADVPIIQIMTMNGKTTGRLVSLDSIRVGETEAMNVPTIVHTFEGGIEGILGNTFLGRYAVTLDAGRRVLHLRPRP